MLKRVAIPFCARVDPGNFWQTPSAMGTASTTGLVILFCARVNADTFLQKLAATGPTHPATR